MVKRRWRNWPAGLRCIPARSVPGGKSLPNFSYGSSNYSPLTLAGIRAILSSSDINAIKALNGVLDAYNSSGDSVAFDPSLPPTGKANPQQAQTIADIPWADSP